MGMTFWQFIAMKKKEAKENGERFTQTMLSEQLGIGRTYLNEILSGKKIISYKMADIIEATTNKLILANELLEESISWHRKYLERNSKLSEHTKNLK